MRRAECGERSAECGERSAESGEWEGRHNGSVGQFAEDAVCSGKPYWGTFTGLTEEDRRAGAAARGPDEGGAAVQRTEGDGRKQRGAGGPRYGAAGGEESGSGKLRSGTIIKNPKKPKKVLDKPVQM